MFQQKVMPNVSLRDLNNLETDFQSRIYYDVHLYRLSSFSGGELENQRVSSLFTYCTRLVPINPCASRSVTFGIITLFSSGWWKMKSSFLLMSFLGLTASTHSFFLEGKCLRSVNKGGSDNPKISKVDLAMAPQQISTQDDRNPCPLLDPPSSDNCELCVILFFVKIFPSIDQSHFLFSTVKDAMFAMG